MKKVLIILMLIPLIGCTSKKTKELANQVYETENIDGIPSDERIRELTIKIRKVEEDIENTLNLYKNNGDYHRAMGIKMIHYKMYLKAYEHFNKALEFYPDSEMLHYYRGLTAANYGKLSDLDSIERDYIKRAEKSYLNSIEINPGFVRGLYGLAILYVYELDRPDDAIPLLDRILGKSAREFDSMLLRALLYERDDDYNRALELYNKVLKLSKADNHIEIATTNREKVLRKLNE